MKIKIFIDSGANIHSCKERIVDLEKDIGLEIGEWENMDEDDKYKIVEEWAFNNGLEIYWEDVK